MIRLQAQLEKSQAVALRKLSMEQGVSMAELIRRGVAQQPRSQTRSSRRDHVERLGMRIQQFDPGPKDLAKEHDRYLAEAFGQDGDLH